MVSATSTQTFTIPPAFLHADSHVDSHTTISLATQVSRALPMNFLIIIIESKINNIHAGGAGSQ